MRRTVLAWWALVAVLAGGPATAAAQSSSGLRSLSSSLYSGMQRIGGASGAYVLDLSTGQTLFSYAAGAGRLPGSVEKLYTTATALVRLGPSATLTTAVLGKGMLDRYGGWHGTLYLKGGGDPTLGSARFDQSAYGTGASMEALTTGLASNTGIRSVHGRIVGDESYFDSLRGTPATGFGSDLADVEGLLSGLAYDRGFGNFEGTVAQPRPALYATRQFVAALRGAAIRVPASTPVYTAQAPPGTPQLAAVHSPRIAKLVQLTNTPSDNYLAEMLLKALGARFGGAGTTAAGAAVVRSELAAKFGIGPQLNDGSGLSRSDYTSPQQVASLLRQMYSNSDFFKSLAIAGETGTLKHEMRGTVAQDNCRGKTGTLHDVANLAGYCQARDGHTLVFAFLANAIGDPSYVHAVEANDMAVAVASYDG